MKFLDNIFGLSHSGSTPRREVVAGLTTFMTMAYILVVNPSMLASTGMDQGAVFTATALSSAVACVLMGLVANLPIALAPGLGINAFFAYTIVLQMGYSWQMALAAVFVEGLVFILLSVFNIRNLIIGSIPLVLKRAIGVGIGLFVTTIGLVNSGIIVRGEVFSQLGDVCSAPVMLTLVAIIIIGVLMVHEVQGALMIGMLITTIVAVFMGVVTIPEGFSPVAMPSSIEPILFKMDFSQLLSVDMFVIIFILIFADLFDTAGTLFAVCSRSGLVDEQGNIKGAKRAFLSDAMATTFGAMLGTSSVTSYVESTSGVAAGGRTGMTAVVTGVLFLCALIFTPIFALIPVAATSAVLVVVGLFMVSSIGEIDFSDYKDSLPAFITIVFIPFSYSISEGIVFGFLSYVAIRIFTGQFRDLTPVMYLLATLFLLKVILV
ncbi:MAG: NCS2 family permease [Rikenellaceae bacterium]